MAMTLPMLNTTHNSNPVCNTDLALHCDNILLSHWIICILRGSSRNVGSWNVQIYSMLIILRWSQNSKRWVGQQYIVIFHLTCTSQQHSLVSAKTLSMFSTNHIMWCEEVTNKKATLNLVWMVRLERISRKVIWIGFHITFCGSLKRMKCFSLSNLLNMIGFQSDVYKKSDLV